MTRRWTMPRGFRVPSTRRPRFRPWSPMLCAAVVASCGSPSGPDDPGGMVVLSEDVVALTAFGETRRVTALVYDRSGSELSGVEVDWSSSNELVATVADGLITAVGTGAATMTANAGGRMAYLQVTVQPPGAGATGPSFAGVVQEILDRRDCTRGMCHAGGAGYLALTFSVAGNYANLVNVRSHAQPSALRVKPGDAANSYLIMKLEGRGSGERMPLGLPPLSAADLDNIRDWIDAGAANN